MAGSMLYFHETECTSDYTGSIYTETIVKLRSALKYDMVCHA